MPLPILTPTVYGDHPGVISGFTHTGGFTINTILTMPSETLVGDSDVLTGFAVGGGNTLKLTGGNMASVIGDAITVNGFAHAGGNTVTVASFAVADAAGTAVTMSGFAQGGHNTVSAGAFSGAFAYGDALTMTDFAKGGHNTVTGSSGHDFTTLFGDAGTMSGFAQGGSNMVVGRATNPSIMYGDAFTLTGFARGGGNTLIAPALSGGIVTSNTLYGDGHDLLGFASGGGNTLIGGQGANDTMWGDAAVVAATAHTRANTFEFAPSNAHDTIMDFHSGRDHIDLQGFGFSSFEQLATHFQTTANGLDIVFDANNDVLLHGVTTVTAGDFAFT
jgi:hypothetical protein